MGIRLQKLKIMKVRKTVLVLIVRILALNLDSGPGSRQSQTKIKREKNRLPFICRTM